MMSNPKIIALDLKNASIKNMDFWLLNNNYIRNNTTKDYIRKIVLKNSNADPIDMIFVINDVVFGRVKKNNSSSIEMFEPLREEILQITPVTLDQIEAYRNVIMDWIFNTHKAKANTAMKLSAFQTYKDKNNFIYPNFNFCITTIDVKELGIILKEFFIPLNDKFKAIVQEFRNYYGKGQYLNTVKLNRIFLLERFILGYSFQLKDETHEHFFWNIHLEEQLFLLETTKFDDKIPLTIDAILDKIKLNGLENLTAEELNYLTNHSKSK
jgi:hypothetical protein